MDAIICQHCDAIDQYFTSVAGPHIKATCESCGKFIKFLPQGGVPTFYFGKYKGRTLPSMVSAEEQGYIQWLLDNTEQSAKFKLALEQHLDNLKQV